jgi:hypothetical protein
MWKKWILKEAANSFSNRRFFFFFFFFFTQIVNNSTSTQFVSLTDNVLDGIFYFVSVFVLFFFFVLFLCLYQTDAFVLFRFVLFCFCVCVRRIFCFVLFSAKRGNARIELNEPFNKNKWNRQFPLVSKSNYSERSLK